MTSITKTKLDELRGQILPVLMPLGIKRVALFGSMVRGEETEKSDIDILVKLKPPNERSPIGLKWFGLAEQLSHILEYPVDLVTEDGLSPYIRPYVEQEMIIIYEEE